MLKKKKKLGVLVDRLDTSNTRYKLTESDMYECFDCHLPGCGGFTGYFPAVRPRTTLAFPRLKTVVQNASLEAELLDLTAIP